MNTNHNTPHTRRRTAAAAATMLVAAGAVVAGALDVAAPANADGDRYVALALSQEKGPDGWGNEFTSENGAQQRSLTECAKYGGTHCVMVIWAKNGCAAIAVGDHDAYGGYKNYWGMPGATLADAEKAALDKNGGGHILLAKCSTGTDGIG
jgi:hypothetical protein